MDDLGFAILRELTWLPGDPIHRGRGIQHPWDVARSLRVHGNTVKRRMAQMTQDGVLGGVHAIPLPKALGLRCSLFALHHDGVARKRAAVDAVREFPGAGGFCDFFGDELWVTFLARSGDDPRGPAAAFAAATGARAAPKLLLDLGWPSRESALTPLDERVLRGFSGDAFRPHEEVADEIGITPRMLSTRLRRLMDAGSFCVRPQVNLAPMRGALAFVLAAELPPEAVPRAHARLLQAFPEAFDRSTPDLATAYLFLPARDVRGIREATERAARAAPEATEVRALFVCDTGTCHEGVQALLRAGTAPAPVADEADAPARPGAPAITPSSA